MKIVIAPDKFKGSLTGIEFCKAVEEGITRIIPNALVNWLPMADGGDGTIEVVNFYLKGDVVTTEVSNPFFQPIRASYLFSKSSKTAFIEMAEASGLKLLKPEEFDCINATTLGTGQMILDAVHKGATKIILGLGGSATNDCGVGMASALGYRFLDKNNEEVKPIGTNLSRIVGIERSHVLPRLNDVTFEIACDVTNPLYGPNGAAHVYAKQKGASQNDIEVLDKGLQYFSKLLDAHFNISSQDLKGAGAAGGMGIASKVFLNGDLEPGIKLIKKLANFNRRIVGADWIITGEGTLDAQTLSGKTIQGVMTSAKAKNIKLAVFCGAIDLDKENINRFGIVYADAVLSHAKNLKDAMDNSKSYVTDMAENFARSLITNA